MGRAGQVGLLSTRIAWRLSLICSAKTFRSRRDMDSGIIDRVKEHCGLVTAWMFDGEAEESVVLQAGRIVSGKMTCPYHGERALKLRIAEISDEDEESPTGLDRRASVSAAQGRQEKFDE